MPKLIIRLELEVVDMDRAKAIKQAIESQAVSLPEDVDVNTRYDEKSEDL